MKKSQYIILGLFLSHIFAITTSSAEEAEKFDASMGVGFMLIDSGNNLQPKGSDKFLNDLNSAAERELSIIPALMASISYDIGDTGGLKLYLNTKPPIDEVGGFVINTGGNYPITDIGIFDVNVFFAPFGEAWENPYAVGTIREETSTLKFGAKVALNRILGSGLRVNLVYMNDDVDDDLIGALVPELARDGSVFALNANYSFNVSKVFEIRPRVSLRKGDYDGESNSFTKYKFDLEARYTIKEWELTIMPRVYYSYSEYDELNPIFNETRKDDGYGAKVMVNYMTPLDWKSWSIQGLVGFSKGDSNITFYDTESFSTGLLVSYRF